MVVYFIRLNNFHLYAACNVCITLKEGRVLYDFCEWKDATSMCWQATLFNTE